ncbi:MAG: SH3 domain-containing protein [Chloroflexi bacterium]|nr:SH3 domain-containing protein [Chloroflexota bacterium]
MLSVLRKSLSLTAPRLLRLIGLLLALLILISPAAPALIAQAAPAEQSGTGIASAARLNIRSGPGTGFGVIATVDQGAVFNLISRNLDATWVEVALVGGIRGWVSARLITPFVPLASLPVSVPVGASSAFVTAAFLNVRSGPNAGFPVITTLSQNTPLNVVGRVSDNSWVQITTPGGVRGWVSSAFIAVNIPLSGLPITGSTVGTVILQPGQPGVLVQPQPGQPALGDISGSGIITAGSLNVRQGPGTAFRVITNVRSGQLVRLIGRTNNFTWLLVQVPDGRTGWVSATYVLPTISLNSLPVRF